MRFGNDDCFVVIDLTDGEGHPCIRDLLRAATLGGGFVTYQSTQVGSSQLVDTQSYAPPSNLGVG